MGNHLIVSMLMCNEKFKNIMLSYYQNYSCLVAKKQRRIGIGLRNFRSNITFMIYLEYTVNVPLIIINKEHLLGYLDLITLMDLAYYRLVLFDEKLPKMYHLNLFFGL